MISQELWNTLERKSVASSSAPLLQHPDSTSDVRDMRICCGKIY